MNHFQSDEMKILAFRKQVLYHTLHTHGISYYDAEKICRTFDNLGDVIVMQQYTDEHRHATLEELQSKAIALARETKKIRLLKQQAADRNYRGLKVE